MKRLFAALAVACALAAAGCTTSQSSARGWRQIAVGTGAVIGQNKADGQVAKASAKLAEECGALQLVAAGATTFAPEKQRQPAAIASAADNTVCASPPANVASALTTAAKTYEAVRAAQPGVNTGSPVKELAAPLRDLVGVDVELLR